MNIILIRICSKRKKYLLISKFTNYNKKQRMEEFFLKIFIQISSKESYRKFLIFYSQPSDW